MVYNNSYRLFIERNLIMENYSDQSKENQFKDWFEKKFDVDEKGQFIHQNIQFSFNKNNSFITINSLYNDMMEVILVNNDFCYIEQPYVLLSLSSKRLITMKDKYDQPKLDSMMAMFDVMKMCEQYLKDTFW